MAILGLAYIFASVSVIFCSYSSISLRLAAMISASSANWAVICFWVSRGGSGISMFNRYSDDTRGKFAPVTPRTIALLIRFESKRDVK